MQTISKSKLGISRMILVVVVVVVIVVAAAGGLYFTSLTSSSSTTSSTTNSTTSASSSATGVTSTGSSSTCKPTATNPPSAITIGASIPLSGGFVSSGTPLLDGAQAAVQYINQVRGGIYVQAYCESLPLKFVYYDDQSTPSIAVGIYNKLISQGVNALWGSYGTPIVYAYADLVEQSGLPMIVTNAFGDNIWLQNFTNIYCTCPLASHYGEIQASTLLKDISILKGPRLVNAVLIADQNENVISQVDSYYKVLTSMGIHVVYNDTVPDGLTSYATQVAAIKAANPTFMFIFIEDTPSLVTFDKELAVENVHPAVFDETVTAPGVLQSLGSDALGIVDASSWTPSAAPVNESDVAKQLSFFLNYSKAQGWSTAIQSTATNGWGGIIIMADAIQAAGSLDHSAIVQALKGPFYDIYGPYQPVQPYHTVEYQPVSVDQVQTVNGTVQAVQVYPTGPGTYPPQWPKS